MNNQEKAAHNNNEQPVKQGDTTVNQNPDTFNVTQQGEVNKIDDNTKLENGFDFGDLNDDD